MAYDEALADRIRAVLTDEAIDEKKMFGGLCFLLRGHMVCGLAKEDFMVRVGPDAHDAALALPYARPMDFTGRPLKGMVYVDLEGLKTKKQLEAWVRRGFAHAESLPPKKPAVKKNPAFKKPLVAKPLPKGIAAAKAKAAKKK